MKKQLDIVVSPSPTCQFVSIDYRGNEQLKLNVLSACGNIILTMDIKESPSHIDFSDKTKGMYMLEFSDRFGNLNTYCIIK